MKRHVAKAVKSAPGLRSILADRKVLKVESRGKNFMVTAQD